MSDHAASMEAYPGCALGRQMTVEFYDCDARILADTGKMEQIFTSSAKQAGATVISSHFHSFMPQGVSGVVVISESHFAVHAWPEHEYAAVDLFTCGENVDFDCAVKSIAASLGSGHWVVSSLIDRGIVGNNGVERLVPVTEGRNIHSFQLSWKSRFEKTGARAFSVAIDLYEASGISDWDDVAISGAAAKIAAVLGITAEGVCRITSNTSGSRRFVREFEDTRIAGVINPDAQTVYIDIFSNVFFDPREAAETALTSFSSSYYRMQPCVRQ